MLPSLPQAQTGMPPVGAPPVPAAGGPPPPDPQKLKATLTGYVSQAIRPTISSDKAQWNARLRRNELYYRGLQYLAYTPFGSGLVDYQPVSPSQPLALSTASLSNDSLYDYILNLFQGDVDTFVAVLGSRSPNCQAQARDLSNESQVRLKLLADRAAAFLYSHWNVDLLHSELTRGVALYGTMFSYTRFVVNPRKLGNTPIQTYRTVDVPQGPAYFQCPNCGAETPAEEAHANAASNPAAMVGMPQNTIPCPKCGNPLPPSTLIQPDTIPSIVPNQTLQFPNGSVELSLYNPAHITAPLWVPDLAHAPWLICETEENKGSLVQAYPELRANVYQDSAGIASPGQDPSSMGKYTRELLTSPTGYVVGGSRDQWLHSLVWISPATYEYLPNDRDGQIRDWLLDTYPDGLKVPLVNGEALVGGMMQNAAANATPAPSRLQNERLTSVWASCRPKPTEMLYADPYFECMIQMQDTVNDCVSMLIEQAERSNPFVIADPEILDPDMLRQFSSIPGEFKFAKKGSVGSLDKGFFRVPAATLNPVLIEFIDKYLSWCREITGIQPAIFGGQSNGPEQTAREAEIKRNQALMKLNIPWTQMRKFWAETYENGVHQLAKYSGGQLFTSTPRGTVESQKIDGIEALALGGWFMQCEESMPETIGQRRDFIMNTLTMPPGAQHMLGMGDPNNIVKVQEAVGLSDWSTPGYSTVIAIHQIISQLLQGQPVQPPPPPQMPPDPMTGMVPPPPPPEPPQPSIPFDAFLFDPSIAVPVVKNWLVENIEKNQSNPNGYANVVAYAHAASDAMPPQGPKPDAPKLTLTGNLKDLTPDAQQAVFHFEGIPIAPGTMIALPQPPPAPPMGGGEGHPAAPLPGSGVTPPTPLAAPPSGGLTPSAPGGLSPSPPSGLIQ